MFVTRAASWTRPALIGAILRRLAPSRVITVGGHHHDGQIGKPLLDLAEQLQPVNAGHV